MDTAVRKYEWSWDEKDIVPETISGNPFDAETIKLTHCKDFRLSNKKADGCREDVLDIVKGRRIEISDCQFTSDKRTRVFITAKGGINGLHLKNITLKGVCRWPWDYSLGDWTLYNHNPKRPPMSNVVIENNRHESGRKIRVLVLFCETPEIIDSNIRLIRVPMWLVRLWFSVHRLLRKKPGDQYQMEVMDWEVEG